MTSEALAGSVLQSRQRDAWPQAVARAAVLERLGAPLPVEVVHDVGLLLSEADPIVRPVGDAARRRWSALLLDLRRQPTLTQLRRQRLGQPVIAALTAHLLRPIVTAGVTDFASFLRALPAHAETITVRFARLDLDTLRLLAMAEGEAMESPDARHVGQWMQLFEDPAIHDVVNFALEVLPSVLSAPQRAQAQTYAVNGYAGLAREGVIDDMLLTELAWDDDLFAQRWMERELFYHARERARDVEPEHHLVLIDATASMRGLREAFARGTAMALTRHLLRGRRTVEVAFFDSIIHPRVRLTAREHATTHLLGFQDRRGRDYARAFAQLEQLLVELREDTSHRLMITFITHGGCLVPDATMSAIGAMAELTGVFVLPTGPLPAYAEQLTRRHVISADELAGREGRRQAAARVVGL